MLCGEPAEVDIQMRAPYIEAALATGVFTLPSLRSMPTPRIFKTHAAWADLPVAGCTAHAPPPEARILVVVRDPRDVMVSLFYHSRSIKGISYAGTWDEWFEAFVNGTAPLPMAASRGGGEDGSGSGPGEGEEALDGRCDWFEHTLGWWRVAQAHPRQVLPDGLEPPQMAHHHRRMDTDCHACASTPTALPTCMHMLTTAPRPPAPLPRRYSWCATRPCSPIRSSRCADDGLLEPPLLVLPRKRPLSMRVLGPSR